MAAAASYNQQYHHAFSSPTSYNPPSSSSRTKLPTFTSVRSLSNDERGHSRSSRQHALRSTLRSLDTKMSSSVTATTTTATSDVLLIAAAKRADAQQTRIHKRANSSSSLNNSPAVPNGPYFSFTTPYATYEEEPFPDIVPSTSGTSTPKIKPYLRKISSAGKDAPDQGRLDLSKSVSENSALAGLGITDFATLSRTDSLHTGRTTPHARNTSVGSTLSTGSGSFRPTQTFVHPMRQVPNRPYTPATDDEETSENHDILPKPEDIPPALALLMNRSASISSNPPAAPTPLSQTHTAADLGQVPKLTSTSQSNLSTHSSRSRSRLGGRPRGDTNRSLDYTKSTTPSSHTSLDKSFSFVSRRSAHSDDTAPQTREERIQAARRKFEEKEANKTRKAKEEEHKRQQSEYAKSVRKQEREGRRRMSAASAMSSASTRSRPRIPKMQSSSRSLGGRQQEEEGLRALRYDQSSVVTALPRQGTEPGRSEKRERAFGERREKEKGGGWRRFSAWCQTKVLGCGKGRQG